MKHPDHGVFRLLDLPIELRNRIYKEIPCSFDHHDHSLKINQLSRILRQEPRYEYVDHHRKSYTFEATVLRTCKQVHREAYVVMVKTNRFVRVSMYYIMWWNLFLRWQIPSVTVEREHTPQLSGYVIPVSIKKPSGGKTGKEIQTKDSECFEAIHAHVHVPHSSMDVC
jgi:hypothetical protein